MIILFLVLSLSTVSLSDSVSNKTHLCCEGANYLNKSKCANGKPIDLTCATKMMLDPDADADEDFVIDDEGYLLYPRKIIRPDILIEPSEYCLSKLGSEDSNHIAIICFDVVAGTNAEKWYGLRATCGIISVVFLLATLIVYCLVPTLRDLQGKCLMHQIGALAVAMLNLSIIQLSEVEENFCVFAAFFSYFTFMTTFFWLNVTSFQIWKTVVYPNIAGTDMQWYLAYFVYGHGMPIIFLIFLLCAHNISGSHLSPGLGENTCWFSGLTETWAYFYGPISILLILNLIMFVWCISKLWIERKTADDLVTKSLKYKVRLYIKLFLLMGIMWMFEIISSVLEDVHAVLDYIWIVTDYINVLQGVLIFTLLVVCRRRALRGLSNRGFCCVTFPSAWKNLEDEEISAAEDDHEQVTEVANGQA